MYFVYAPPFSYVEKAPFFSTSRFLKSSLVSSPGGYSPDKFIILYDPLDILIQNHFKSPTTDPRSWCDFFIDILSQVRQPGIHAISIWRLAHFFDKCGHIDVPVNSSESHNILYDFQPPSSSASFQHFAAAVVRDEPLLLNSYLDLELCSLLLGSQIDSNWLARMKSSKYMALDLLEEFRVLSASLDASHADLEIFFVKSRQQATLLEGYAELLNKSLNLNVRKGNITRTRFSPFI